MGPTRLRSLPVSAASGLVRLGGCFYIVADDELGLLALPDDGPPQTFALLPGTLPDEPRARKASKPDFEALCRWPHDLLLALGSGSTPARHTAALIARGADRLYSQVVAQVDMRPLHAHLAATFPALNLEGAAVVGDALVLLQRGNGPGNHSALIELDLDAAMQALTHARAWPPTLLRAIYPVELGARGSALGFTDASPLPDGSLLFTAVAEASPDTYQDGEVTGAVIGRVDLHGTLRWVVDFPEPVKLEGIHAELDGDDLRVWLVTDPDDRARAGDLYTARMDPRTGAWRR